MPNPSVGIASYTHFRGRGPGRRGLHSRRTHRSPTAREPRHGTHPRCLPGSAARLPCLVPVQVRFDGGPWQNLSAADGTWRWVIDTTATVDGTHLIEAQAVVGSSSSIVSRTVVVSNANPLFAIFSPPLVYYLAIAVVLAAIVLFVLTRRRRKREAASSEVPPTPPTQRGP